MENKDDEFSFFAKELMLSSPITVRQIRTDACARPEHYNLDLISEIANIAIYNHSHFVVSPLVFDMMDTKMHKPPKMSESDFLKEISALEKEVKNIRKGSL
ncbi:hypothetical protein [Lacticaseibacillus mingshuiensis]|uniref:hypothetical protein n=1 Tax=Lacticaseibacillus mingshuiensis TaxID=2799574 RepID=UPI00194F5B6C|nr:hypothetical protein [Lacticaseibacillus mingshuiensis]